MLEEQDGLNITFHSNDAAMQDENVEEDWRVTRDDNYPIRQTQEPSVQRPAHDGARNITAVK